MTDNSQGQLGEAIQLVKDYARQETIGPLKGAGRWIARGLAGAFLLSVGSFLIVLGLLRLLQHEAPGTFAGRWMSLVPYAVALVAAVVVIGIAVWRMTKPTLQKEARP